VLGGENAGEHGLKLYRERHRSTMMSRASEVFAHISGGDYERLTSRVEREREQLIAVARDGTARLADQLSKGTRFQLYLALRIAGFDEFTRHRTALPFIADDILETFDDERAARAFEGLAAMAASGQVIYLTHHRHLCDIARRAVPGVRIHALG